MKRLLLFLALVLVLPAAALGVLTDGTHYWDYDNNFTDLAGSADQTNNGGNRQDTGGILGGMFNLTTSSTIYSTSAALGSGQKTLSLWVYPDTATSGYMLADSVTLQVYFNGANDLIVHDYTSAKLSVLSANTGINYGEWNHIVVLANSSDSEIYINGVSRALSTSTGIPDFGNATGTTYYGAFSSGTAGIDGGLDEIGTWDRLLSPSEIASLYNAGAGFNPYKENITNVTVTVDSDQITANPTFNISLFNGTDTFNYYDRSGTITTDILTNYTGLWNVTVNSTDHYQRNLVAVNLSGGNLTVVLQVTDKTVTSRFVESNNPITVSNSYVTLNSFDYEPLANTTAYVTSTIQINTSAASTAQCRILVDGDPDGSTASRTLQANQFANIFLTTDDRNISPEANATVQVQCRKTSGANFQADKLDVLVVSLNDEADGQNITNKHFNDSALPVNTTWQSVYSDNFTTSEYNLSDNRNLAWIFNYRARLNYGATTNASFQLVLNGDTTVCTNITRYGASGSTGSIGNACYLNGLEPNTTYDVEFFASTSAGTATINDLTSHAFEVVLPVGSINENIVSDLTVNDTQNIANISMFNPIGGNYTVDILGSVNLRSVSGTQDATVFLGNDQSNLTSFTRTITNNGNANIVLIGSFAEAGIGTQNYKIYVECPSGNCVVENAEIMGFIVNQENITPNEFLVNAWDEYNSSPINVFNVTTNGGTLSTTNGTVVVPTSGVSQDVTVRANNYFANFTVGHDTSTDLNATLYEYTRIYAKNFSSGSFVENFTVLFNSTNYTANGRYVNIPLYNNTEQIRIDAEGFAFEFENLTANPYLQNATINLFTTNLINFTFYDAETTKIIDYENVTVFLTGSLQSYNFTTDAGIYSISLIEPDNYTITYSADGYFQGEQFFTINNRTTNKVDLFLVNSSESEIVATVVNELTATVEGVVIKLQRRNLSGTNYYETDACITSPAGTCILHANVGEATYRAVLSIGGVVNRITGDFKFTSTTQTFRVSTAGNPLSDVEELLGISSSLNGSVNANTSAFTFNWDDTNGNVQTACITIQNRIYAQTSNTSQCNVGASGGFTFSRAIGSAQEVCGSGYFITSDGIVYADTICFSTDSGSVDDFGEQGVFLYIILFMLSIILSFTLAAQAAIIIPVVAALFMAFGYWVGLVSISTISIAGFIILCAVVVAVVRR